MILAAPLRESDLREPGDRRVTFRVNAPVDAHNGAHNRVRTDDLVLTKDSALPTELCERSYVPSPPVFPVFRIPRPAFPKLAPGCPDVLPPDVLPEVAWSG